jgi:hypothetical protein
VSPTLARRLNRAADMDTTPRCLLLAALLLGGCVQEAVSGPGGAPGAGSSSDPSCVDPGSCPGSGPGASGSGGPGGSSCGEQTVPIGGMQIEPNVLLVIDRSGSMAKLADNDVSRWDGLKTSLDAVLDQNAGKARWGLSLFPAGTQNSSCTPGAIDVPVAMGTEAAIKAAVNAFSTSQVDALEGRTPTGTTMNAVKSSGALVDPTRSNYVVLMTDGAPNCNSQDQVQPAIDALYAQSPSVRTFVIGFGADVTSSQGANLNAWAVAGHTDRPGAEKYYVANTVADLQQAFSAIVAGVATCTYQLQAPPADPDLVAPYLDGAPVQHDATNGFTYDAGSQTVSFHGTVCDLIRSGSVTKVEFIYGCAAPDVL